MGIRYRMYLLTISEMGYLGDVLRHYFRNAMPSDILSELDFFINCWTATNAAFIFLATLMVLVPVQEKNRRLTMISVIITSGIYLAFELTMSVLALGLDTLFHLDSVAWFCYFIATYLHNR